jgi:opacity protein-like surface antigen
MTKFLVATVSTLAFASAAFAADMPTSQPPPPAPVIGKAPIPIIGKLPVVGKAPFGKSLPPPPVIARG